MFDGETDANSRGIPISSSEAGYWPWWPKLYRTCAPRATSQRPLDAFAMSSEL